MNTKPIDAEDKANAAQAAVRAALEAENTAYSAFRAAVAARIRAMAEAATAELQRKIEATQKA